jgi:hypothetical protein
MVLKMALKQVPYISQTVRLVNAVLTRSDVPFQDKISTFTFILKRSKHFFANVSRLLGVRGELVAEWFRSLPSNHLSLIAVGVWTLSCEEAFQLAYGTAVVLLN